MIIIYFQSRSQRNIVQQCTRPLPTLSLNQWALFGDQWRRWLAAKAVSWHSAASAYSYTQRRHWWAKGFATKCYQCYQMLPNWDAHILHHYHHCPTTVHLIVSQCHNNHSWSLRDTLYKNEIMCDFSISGGGGLPNSAKSQNLSSDFWHAEIILTISCRFCHYRRVKCFTLWKPPKNVLGWVGVKKLNFWWIL